MSETIETAKQLEDRVGTKLCAVVVNGRLPTLSLPTVGGAAELARLAAAAGASLRREEAQSLMTAGELRAQRQRAQEAQVARLALELPVPQLELPFCFTAELGPEQLEILTDAFALGTAGWEGPAAAGQVEP